MLSEASFSGSCFLYSLASLLLFYFDFEGSVKDKGVAGLITELEKTSQHFKFLGCYKETV